MTTKLLAAATIAVAGMVSTLAPAGSTDMNTADSTRYLSRADGRIAYDDVGSGPLVVMVPGLGDLRQEYRLLAPRLAAEGYRVVTMDLRGHGQSTTGWSDYTSSAIGSDIVALVEQLNAGPATVIGTSMGAAAAAWAAAEAPARIERLVLVGPFVRDIPPTSWLAGVSQAAIIQGALLRPWGPWAWGKVYATFYGQLPSDFEAYRARLSANLKEEGRMEALQAMIAASKADAEARLHEVKAPVLVVMGSADPDFADPRKEADTVAHLLRGTVSMVEGAGHYPHVEQPDTVIGAVVSFIRGGEQS